MIIHVVEQGETIYSISEKYNQSPQKIIDENEITNPDNLVVGQTIVITEPNETKLRSITVNGYVYPNVSPQVMDKTLPNLSLITIFTYGFTPEGNLITIDDEAVINLSRSYGVAPLMLISTLTEDGTFSNELADILLNDEALQDVLINNIRSNILLKNYFGLDIDFEFIPESDRELYTAFIAKTTQELNSYGFPVIVALAPKTSADQPGLLYESHDYNAIGKAANAVLIMTYEWGYTYDYARYRLFLPVLIINSCQFCFIIITNFFT